MKQPGTTILYAVMALGAALVFVGGAIDFVPNMLPDLSDYPVAETDEANEYAYEDEAWNRGLADDLGRAIEEAMPEDVPLEPPPGARLVSQRLIWHAEAIDSGLERGRPCVLIVGFADGATPVSVQLECGAETLFEGDVSEGAEIRRVTYRNDRHAFSASVRSTLLGDSGVTILDVSSAAHTITLRAASGTLRFFVAELSVPIDSDLSLPRAIATAIDPVHSLLRPVGPGTGPVPGAIARVADDSDGSAVCELMLYRTPGGNTGACRTMIRCDGELLYGTPNQGYIACEDGNGIIESALDDGPISVDRDLAVTIDVGARTVTLSDSDWSQQLTLVDAPACERVQVSEGWFLSPSGSGFRWTLRGETLTWNGAGLTDAGEIVSSEVDCVADSAVLTTTEVLDERLSRSVYSFSWGFGFRSLAGWSREGGLMWGQP